MSKFKISSYSIINKRLVITNGNLIEFPEEFPNDGKYLKEIYKQLSTKYAKFYKMDRLCKLAFLTSEFLLADDLHKRYRPDEVAMVFSNSYSSFDTDEKHNQSISDPHNYFPEPATFIYTLPNIMLGELSIRYDIKGENIFFISEKFDVDFILNYVINLLSNTRHKACVVGRTDYTSSTIESSMFFVEQVENINHPSISPLEEGQKGAVEFNAENIQQLINGSK